MNFFHRWHLTETVWEGLELLDSVGQPYWSSSERNWEARNRVPAESMSIGCWLALASERTRQNPAALQELTDRRPLAELDHLAQADAGSWEGGIMTDSIHQLLSLPPRHLDGLRVDAHDCLREVRCL